MQLLNSPTVAEFSIKYGLKPAYVLELIRKGLLPIIHIGEKPLKPYRIDESAAEKMVISAPKQRSLKHELEIARFSHRTTKRESQAFAWSSPRKRCK